MFRGMQAPSLWSMFTDWSVLTQVPEFLELAKYFWLRGAIWGIVCTLIARVILGSLATKCLLWASTLWPRWAAWQRRREIARIRAAARKQQEEWDCATDPGA